MRLRTVSLLSLALLSGGLGLVTFLAGLIVGVFSNLMTLLNLFFPASRNWYLHTHMHKQVSIGKEDDYISPHINSKYWLDSDDTSLFVPTSLCKTQVITQNCLQRTSKLT